MTMPTIEIRNWNNEKVGTRDLPEEVFGVPYKEQLIHEAVRHHLAAVRSGTHKTKVRSEVSGSGRKPFRQKGTGRARQGGGRPGIHRHGGTIHGPVPRDYSFKMNRKEKKIALRSALSRKVAQGELLLLSDMNLEEAKTGSLARTITGLGVDGRALLVDSLDNLNLVLASRNHPRMGVADASNVSVYDIVNAKWVVISEQALDRLTEVLSK